MSDPALLMLGYVGVGILLTAGLARTAILQATLVILGAAHIFPGVLRLWWLALGGEP